MKSLKFDIELLVPEGGSHKATLVVLLVVVVVISSVKSLRLFNTQRSATKLCIHIHADIAPTQILHLFSN